MGKTEIARRLDRDEKWLTTDLVAIAAPVNGEVEARRVADEVVLLVDTDRRQRGDDDDVRLDRWFKRNLPDALGRYIRCGITSVVVDFEKS